MLRRQGRLFGGADVSLIVGPNKFQPQLEGLEAVERQLDAESVRTFLEGLREMAADDDSEGTASD